ncbi:HRDC domain-containing protein [Paenibacillus sp. 1P03SA]|uniref:HRDC domain-containing protein n=1 Tax=Paenibacillus sp. 1P03SA TaxID=3132294 RepID=UPI00399FAA42
MNVIYLTTLEKQVEEGKVKQAQFYAGEKTGIWQAMWNEVNDNGKPVQEIWYEGISWEELVGAIKRGLQLKLAEGFKPMLRGVGEEQAGLSAKAEMTQLLQYYGELHADESVYEELRAWRREQSFKEGRSPFILASNRMLQMIAAFCPQSLEELLHIPGFGQNRASKYGGDVLRITRDKQRHTDFPLGWVAAATDRAQFEAWMSRQLERRVQKKLHASRASADFWKRWRTAAVWHSCGPSSLLHPGNWLPCWKNWSGMVTMCLRESRANWPRCRPSSWPKPSGCSRKWGTAT